MRDVLNETTRRWLSIVATITALGLTLLLGLALVGVSIWGFWICRSFADSAADEILGRYAAPWARARFALSWMVLFAPIALAGAFVVGVTLKQIFGKPDQSWAYPFRLFMSVVGMRIVAEHHTKTKRLQAEGENVLEGTIEPKE